MGYLIDTSKTDGMARITLYRSSPTVAWANVGTMLVQLQSESPQMYADDKTKFKAVVVTLKWGSIC